MNNTQLSPIRGFLMHLTHYDPAWCAKKDQEGPFDKSVAFEVIDALAENGLNMLIIDCADAVIYQSHPELQRHYSLPMENFKEICRYAERAKIEVVPKLNFSQSRFYRHNHWMYPHNENVGGRDIFEQNEYWEIAFEIIDELIAVSQPSRFFHIGMDEDHDRSHQQFSNAINLLAEGLRRRTLRSIIWRDTRLDPRGCIFNEKQTAAEKFLAKDIVRMVWNYEGVNDTETIQTMKKGGFEIWGAIAGGKPETAAAWTQVLTDPANPCPGIIITNWKHCSQAFRNMHLAMIESFAKIYPKKSSKN